MNTSAKEGEFGHHYAIAQKRKKVGAMPEHLWPMSDLLANPSNRLMNYRMFFFHLFKASSSEASISFLRLCADKEFSCRAPPVVVWHKSTICVQ